jgi:hypothetical protein
MAPQGEPIGSEPMRTSPRSVVLLSLVLTVDLFDVVQLIKLGCNSWLI